MSAILRLGLVIAAGYLGAGLARPWLHRRRAGPWLILSLLGALFCAGILFIPSERSGLRAIACLFLVDLLLRLADTARCARRGPPLAAASSEFLRFLRPIPLFLATGEEWTAAVHPQNRPRVDWRRGLLGTAVHAGAWIVLLNLRANETLASSFLLDHLVKVVLFVVAIESGAQALVAAERLLGFATELPMDRIYVSRTPAEFWGRYNRRVRAWLFRNVFLPVGGARRPARGVVLVFVVSAVLHELMFDIATSRVTGYQAAFFLAQIPAVLLSPPLERFARRGLPQRLAAHAATVGWMTLSSMFFFRQVEDIFPFLYTSQPWLP